MKATKYFTLLLVVFAIGQIQAQQTKNAFELMREGKTYAEICKIMHKKNTKALTRRSSGAAKARIAKGQKQFRRWEHFWKARLLPNGNFPSPQVMQQAWQQMQTGFHFDDCQWQYFGPTDLPSSKISFYPGLGRINTIAIHPGNKKLLLAGGAGSGIWRSIDNGKTWEPTTDYLPNVGISDIVFDPNRPHIVYAATGDADGGRAPYSTGLFKSLDKGKTWFIVGLEQLQSARLLIRRIEVLKAPANTIIATTNKGIYRSTNGGWRWKKVSKAPGYSLLKLTDKILYTGTSNGKVYKSTNAGSTWNEITPANISLKGRVELGITPADPNLVIGFDAGTFEDNPKAFKSIDQGKTWTSLPIPQETIQQGGQTFSFPISTQGGYNMTVAVSPTNPQLIIFGGVHGWRSKDGGNTWEKYLDGYWEKGQPYFYVHSDHHMMRFKSNQSNILYVAHDGGVAYGDMSQSAPFTDITQGLFTTQYYGIGLLPTDDKVVIGGAQDNDGIYINAKVQKGILPGSDGFDGLIDYSNPKIAYATTTGASRVVKTTDGWKTSSDLTIPGFRTSWEVPMAIHPTNPKTIFFAGNKLMKSSDRGKTWKSLYNAPVIDPKENFTDDIMELTISPVDGNMMVISLTSNTLLKTTDGGKTWKELTNVVPKNSQNVRISGIAINSHNPDILYVTLSGFEKKKKVFQSRDGGKTWKNISYNLPNIPVNDIVYVTGSYDDLYVATDLGVYYNTADDNFWTCFSTDLPYTQVMELEIHYATQTLFTATYGRGIWRSPLAETYDYYDYQANNQFETHYINVYPTLNDGHFTLDISKADAYKNGELYIYNRMGGVVLQQTLKSDGKQSIDISKAVDGMYFVTIRKGKNFETKRIKITHK